MQILMAHFKNYKKEVLSAIISIFIVAFVAVWQPRLLQLCADCNSARQSSRS